MNDKAWIAYEQRLGFPLPVVLRSMFEQVGNTRGTRNGDLFSISIACDRYHEYVGECEVGEPPWPERLLPVCDWGCGIVSSLWCVPSNLPVIRNDGNQDYTKLRTELLASGIMARDQHGFFEQYGKVFGTSWVEASSLADWLQKRKSGLNFVWNDAYSKKL